MDESTQLDRSTWFDKKSTLKYLPLTIFSILSFILFLPFCGAVLLGAVFALALNQYVKKLKYKDPIFFKSAYIIVFVAFLVVLVFPIGLFSAKFYSFLAQPAEIGVDSISYFSNPKEVSTRLISPFLNKLEIKPSLTMQNWIDLQVTDASNYILMLIEKTIAEVPQLFFLFFIFLISLYYFMSESLRIKYWFYRSRLFNISKAQSFVKILLGASHSTVLSTMIVAVIQASIVGAGSLLLNVGDVLLIWILTFFLSFIPLFGTAPITIFLSFFMFAKGQNAQGVGMLVVGLITGTIDNVLRSFLISHTGDKSEIHPLVALVGLFGAIELMGFTGLFLGPMIMCVCVQMYAEHFAEKQAGAALDHKSAMHNFVHQMEYLTNENNQSKNITKQKI